MHTTKRQTGLRLLGATALAGLASALFIQNRVRAAERENPPLGHFLDCYYPTARADVALVAPAAVPILGDVLRHTVSPLLAGQPGQLRFGPCSPPHRYRSASGVFPPGSEPGRHNCGPPRRRRLSWRIRPGSWSIGTLR
jgi:hypothetical protein